MGDQDGLLLISRGGHHKRQVQRGGGELPKLAVDRFSSCYIWTGEELRGAHGRGNWAAGRLLQPALQEAAREERRELVGKSGR